MDAADIGADRYRQLVELAAPQLSVPWQGAVTVEQVAELDELDTAQLLDQARGFDGATTDDGDYGQAQTFRGRRGGLDPGELTGVAAGDLTGAEPTAYFPGIASGAGWDGELDASSPLAEL